MQPIYSYCKNMEGLRQDVTLKVCSFIGEYVKTHIDKDDIFETTGRAYIQLAKEEPHLLRFLFCINETALLLWRIYTNQKQIRIQQSLFLKNLASA